MIKGLLIACMYTVLFCSLKAQNVFNISDPIVRLDKSRGYRSAWFPDSTKLGLQKFVSIPTNSVSIGVNAWDASSYKSYFINLGNGVRMAFRLKFPRSYTNPDSVNKKYPMMLFLHGAGEVGCSANGGLYNNEKPLQLGGLLFSNRVNNNQFDGFLIFPQMVNYAGCWGAWHTSATGNFTALLAIVDSLVKYTRANNDRLVVNGLSGGGYGAWRMASDYPARVAKIIPSAAAGGTSNRAAFVHVPIWFATGGKDVDPSPASAQYALTQMEQVGADIRYTVYPELGHYVWGTHWNEPGYNAYMNDVHKANPLIFFQRDAFCANETINAKLGISKGYYAYEWQKDGVVIATATGAANTIVQPASVSLYTGNDITVKQFGTYRVRFKRTAAGNWSDYSPKPAVIKLKSTTQTVPISIKGIESNVVPALDGSTLVPLQLPAGYINYQWYRISDNQLVASTQIFNAPAGEYKARYAEQYGCGTDFSPVYTVVNANGTPAPDAPGTATATALSQTSVRIDWTQPTNALNNETGFELYRGIQSGGPYQFIAVTPANADTWQDSGLFPDSTYYYVVRAVNTTGASAKSNEASAKTPGDLAAPAAPSNLQYLGSTSTSILLKWTASADADIKRYDIYANGAKLFSTTATTFNVINLDSLNFYAFVVKAIDNTGNSSAASSQLTGFTHRQGLNYAYYTGAWSMLPDFSALTPARSGVTDSVNINNTAIKTTNVQYGFLWRGFIYIPVTASYTFETISDDGSKLYIDMPYASGATPLVSNDGIHGAQSRFGTISLTQGYHSIAITHFQNVYGYDMQVYWSNNAGLARERIRKNFFSLVNAAQVAPPALPSNLSAAGIAYNKIKLNWADNSFNETGFEITRSLASGGTFVPVATTASDMVTFTDSGLTASKEYFYKIRAAGSESESVYSAPVAATTAEAPLTPIEPSGLVARGSANTIALTWNDNSSNETGFTIYRSTDNIDFSLLTSLPANANAYTDASVIMKTVYYYYVTGTNSSGEGTPGNTTSATAGSTAPVISIVNSILLKTYSIATINFTVSDDATDNVMVSIPNKPSFVTLTHTDGINYLLSFSPTVDNIGWYPLTIAATDNNGQSSSSKVTVSIADKNTRSVYLNFGSAGKTAPLPWNNWLGLRTANSVFNGLKDEANGTTSISVTSVTPWSATTDLGHISGDNSGIVPDAVLQSGIADNSATRQLKIAGLSTAKKYNLVFIGSQNEGLAATSEFAVGTQKAVMDARNNTTRSVNINSLTPDGAGAILVNVTRTGATLLSYLNALIIEEYDPVINLLNPVNLYAEATDRSIVNITWSDRTNNESLAGGYELVRATDSAFSQNTTIISLPAGTTTYRNTGLAANSRYWYRVRAKNGSEYSEFSNQTRVVTPGGLVYINFNTTVANAAFPWNNLAASPVNPFTIGNLKNQNGVNSGIVLKLEETFNGEFTAGVNTGTNTGIVPDNVLSSNYWLDNSQLGQFRLSGLNHTKQYRIGFTGSSSSTGWFKGNYTATYTIQGKTVYLNSWMNATKIVYLNDLAPDAGGEMMLNFSTTAVAAYGFSAGVIIQEYTDTQEDGSIPASNLLLQDALPSIAASEHALKVMAYPNPFTDQIILDFYNTDHSNRVSAELYAINGRLIHRQQYNLLPRGNNTVRIYNLKNIATFGSYIVALKINGKIIQTSKMLKSR